MAESPAAVELMLRLDLPPRLRAQALATLSRCGSLPTFAANSLLQSLVPARDPHFKCPARRVPPALFSRRRVRTGEGSADLERAGGASAARRHPLSVVLPVVCSFLSDDDALCLADTCSWMRSSLLGGHHWLPQRTRALWTCPPELPRWTPATVSAPGLTAAGAGPGGGVLPAHLDPGIDPELGVRFRRDHRADVPAVQQRTNRLGCEGPLQFEQGLPHFGDGRHDTRGLARLGRTQVSFVEFGQVQLARDRRHRGRI